MSFDSAFREANFTSTPIRHLGLKTAGTPLEPILVEFERELKSIGIVRLRPKFYLSTEWGVPFQTIAIGIPFYLAHPELTTLHSQRAGFIEGLNRWDILRYLRHEMGHVVNYGYKLFANTDWLSLFGAMDQDYRDEYRPEPFSRRFVQHLPGWYAQKHPDEDWAETFAVWMTPGRDWRSEYAQWPGALAKLQYCNQTMALLADVDPPVTGDELDEDVGTIDYSLEQYYGQLADTSKEFVEHVDQALRSIFEDYGRPEAGTSSAERLPAGQLITEVENAVSSEVFRWTGHFPERTQHLLRQMRRRADVMMQVYPTDRRIEVIVALTSLVTALAMNHLHRGEYLP